MEKEEFLDYFINYPIKMKKDDIPKLTKESLEKFIITAKRTGTNYTLDEIENYFRVECSIVNCDILKMEE